MLENHDDVWELTVVTLDKPFLFSNISGVLSSFGMDIHRGHALTTPDGLVLDVFQFSDEQGFLELNPGATAEITRMLDRVVAGLGRRAGAAARPRASVLYRRRQRGAAAVCTSTTSTRRSTPSSRSSPTTRSGCCTASAG